MFSRSHHEISDLFPRVILERNFNHKKKVEFYNTAETFVKDGIGNVRGVCDKTRSSHFRTKKVFQLIFFGVQSEHWKLQNRTCEEWKREETKHEFFEFIYFFGIIVIFQKTDFFCDCQINVQLYPEICHIVRVILDTWNS